MQNLKERCICKHPYEEHKYGFGLIKRDERCDYIITRKRRNKEEYLTRSCTCLKFTLDNFWYIKHAPKRKQPHND